jgi:prephenate dehydratase
MMSRRVIKLQNSVSMKVISTARFPNNFLRQPLKPLKRKELRLSKIVSRPQKRKRRQKRI